MLQQWLLNRHAHLTFLKGTWAAALSLQTIFPNQRAFCPLTDALCLWDRRAPWNRPLRSVQRQMSSSLVTVPWHIPSCHSSITADWPYKIETLGDHLSRAFQCALKLNAISDSVLFFCSPVQVPTWEVRGARHGSERLHSAGRAWRIKNTGPHMSFLVSASAINQYPSTLISSSRHFYSATNGMGFLSACWPEAALQRILFLWMSEVYFTLRLWKHTGRQKRYIYI